MLFEEFPLTVVLTAGLNRFKNVLFRQKLKFSKGLQFLLPKSSQSQFKKDTGNLDKGYKQNPIGKA